MSGTAYSVVIVDYEAHQDVLRLRKALFHQGNPQVIVVDAKQLSLGYGQALNKGVEQADNEFVVCMNPDIDLKKDALPKLISALKAHPECGIVGPQVLDHQGKIQLTSSQVPNAAQAVIVWSWLGSFWKKKVQAWYRLNSFDHKTSQYVPSVSGACFAIRRSEWRKIGGADERLFLYFEEFDLAQRYRKLGLKVWFCAESLIVHYGQVSTSAVKGVTRIFTDSRRYWLSKHFGIQGVLAATWLEFWEKKA